MHLTCSFYEFIALVEACDALIQKGHRFYGSINDQAVQIFNIIENN